MRFRTAMLLAAAVVAGAAAHTNGQCQGNELAKLLASDGAAGDQFGRCVAVSGDIAVIGAETDDDLGSASGSAYVFRYDGSMWIEEAKLLASDGAANDYFGTSVAVSGDTIVAGADGDDDNGDGSGSAYVFRHDGASWVEEAKLLPSDGAPYDQFGYAAAISGNIAVIGARLDKSAYVFRYDGSIWTQEAKLEPSDPLTPDGFGESVSISGDCVVVGARCDEVNGQCSGSAYIFCYDGSNWAEQAKLVPSHPAAWKQFGYAVAIAGETAAIGAPNDGETAVEAGAAYVFRFDGSSWVEETKLLASDGATEDGLGCSVGLAADTIVSGAYGDDDNGDKSGSAYVFRYDGANWVEEAKLLPSDGAPNDRFGYHESVAISGDTAVVGAYRDGDNGQTSGSAYIFGGLSDCQPNGVLDLCDIANGTSLDLNGNGIPDECENLCPEDVNGDGTVDVVDLLMLLAAWGPCPGCPEDINGDGAVDVLDLLALLAAWGPCP